MVYKIYWIRLQSHTDIKCEGYVGVSKHYNRRMIEHKCCNKNYHLYNAIQKYGWENLIKEVIAECNSREEALIIENNIRPLPNIGWNTLVGGGNAFPHSEETKAKISRALIGNNNSNGFSDNILICPHCGKSGKEAPMRRWHFEKCNKLK